jgi:Dolichyl-phosphate-mannose-protein mannosyltransferase
LTARHARLGLGRAVALGAYACVLFWSAPRWPDDWDGIGFVESISDFDLARFRPHPPGYPVYVALLRIAASVARTPLQACVIVSVASGVVAIAFAWDALRRRAGARAAWTAAILVAVAPGVWRACSGVGSEAPALACLAACAWALAVLPSGRAAATILGLGAGLGLGVRLSWAPLYVAALTIAPRGSRARACAAAAIGIAAWAVPLVGVVGAATLGSLYADHLSGHATRWGGTVVTEPGGVRVRWLARDVFVDGLGVGGDRLGWVIGLFVVLTLAQALFVWRASGFRGWGRAIGAVVPYVVWIGLGQNLRDQPRHAVPVAALLAAGLALPVARSRTAVALAGALALTASMRTLGDARARRAIAPPGEQLLDLARSQPSPDRLAVFGGASVRFFETSELASRARVAGSLGDALLDVGRFDELPARLWVTNELSGLTESRWPLERIATLCRPPRLDRRMPCLDVYSWKF